MTVTHVTADIDLVACLIKMIVIRNKWSPEQKLCQPAVAEVHNSPPLIKNLPPKSSAQEFSDWYSTERALGSLINIPAPLPISEGRRWYSNEIQRLIASKFRQLSQARRAQLIALHTPTVEAAETVEALHRKLLLDRGKALSPHIKPIGVCFEDDTVFVSAKIIMNKVLHVAMVGRLLQQVRHGLIRSSNSGLTAINSILLNTRLILTPSSATEEHPGANHSGVLT